MNFNEAMQMLGTKLQGKYGHLGFKLTDESLRYHLLSAKKNGITREEIAEIVTHAAFYCGWPRAWAVFRMAKGIWTEEDAK